MSGLHEGHIGMVKMKGLPGSTFGGQTLTRTSKEQSEIAKDVKRQQIIQLVHPCIGGSTLPFPGKDCILILLGHFRGRC